MTQFLQSLFIAALLTPLLIIFGNAIYSHLNRYAGGRLHPYRNRIIAITIALFMTILGMIVIWTRT